MDLAPTILPCAWTWPHPPCDSRSLRPGLSLQVHVCHNLCRFRPNQKVIGHIACFRMGGGLLSTKINRFILCAMLQVPKQVSDVLLPLFPVGNQEFSLWSHRQQLIIDQTHSLTVSVVQWGIPRPTVAEGYLPRGDQLRIHQSTKGVPFRRHPQHDPREGWGWRQRWRQGRYKHD